MTAQCGFYSLAWGMGVEGNLEARLKKRINLGARRKSFQMVSRMQKNSCGKSESRSCVDQTED